jgi:asparagine synthase (glutamine-hydrolysing)
LTVCGIAGELAFRGRRADERVAGAMTAAQACRGPDGEGAWRGGWAALGHRRLTVIDLSDAGAQPMVDDDSGVALVFNGCIYNYRELQAELRDGGPFRSHSDTEVVLRAYLRWGEAFVHRLVGMFALAIVDPRHDKALLVRDRLGVKPLYVARTSERVRFASTLPALLAAGGVDTALDPVGLHHYLSWHSIVPAPRTVLAGVEKLPPATMRRIRSDGSALDIMYWQPAYTRDPAHADWGADRWEQEIEQALRTAVRRRMVADVPVGVLLSGGLDSSLIVALAAEERPDVRTYSIGFDGADAAGDEFVYSDAVAAAFGTDHRRWRAADTDLAAAVRRRWVP